MAAAIGGCGSGGARTTGAGAPAPRPYGPSFGLTEDDAQLLAGRPAAEDGAGARTLALARARLAALHPEYVRLLVDWAKLQPSPEAPPALAQPVDGCARTIGPCAAYRGIAGELSAIAAARRAAGTEGRPAPQVVLDVLGVPAWAAPAPGGCEAQGTTAFARPIGAAGLDGYRALIRALLALGAREGVPLSWWSPWNEPNNAQFLAPQRESCAAGAPSTSPATYARLVDAMAQTLQAAGGTHHLLLGELGGYTASSPQRTSIAEFVAGLPQDVVCASADWSVHAYASYGAAALGAEPVAALEAALDRRGTCGRQARIWITEAGAGAPHAGDREAPSAAQEHEGCLALAAQLTRWVGDARVAAILQYTFRDDPAYPVGLLSADLSQVHPTYRLWLLYTRAREEGRPPPPAAQLCA